MGKKAGPLLLCAALFALAAGLEIASQPTGEAQGYLVTAARSGNDAALSQAAGEFRIVAANLLWAKVVDHYHHQFMAQGGDWAKNESLLPLLKTITELDPHFTQAYVLMGGEILPGTGRVGEGEAVLARGLQNNPNDWEMYRETAMLYAWTEHRPAQALPYARAGRAQVEDSYAHRQMSHDDYVFARSLMTRLCRTLEDQVRHHSNDPLTDGDRPQPPPIVGASSGRSRPSGSG
ncbi:MAG: hypothetical protein JO250_02410 [Armatimonadetes bacterium]|nr:hypothetical protein [Armatimonadota bacterium]